MYFCFLFVHVGEGQVEGQCTGGDEVGALLGIKCCVNATLCSSKYCLAGKASVTYNYCVV